MRISDWSSDVCSSDLLPRSTCGQIDAADGRVIHSLDLSGDPDGYQKAAQGDAPRTDVAGRHRLAAHGAADQPDDDHRRADVHRADVAEAAQARRRKALLGLHALTPDGSANPERCAL